MLTRAANGAIIQTVFWKGDGSMRCFRTNSMMMGMMYMFRMCMMMCAQKHDSPCFISI